MVLLEYETRDRALYTKGRAPGLFNTSKGKNTTPSGVFIEGQRLTGYCVRGFLLLLISSVGEIVDNF